MKNTYYEQATYAAKLSVNKKQNIDINTADLYYPILNVIREESKKYEYKPDTEQNIVVIDEDGKEYARISMSKFLEESSKLLEDRRNAKDAAFSIPSKESFTGDIGCTKLKSSF